MVIRCSGATSVACFGKVVFNWNETPSSDRGERSVKENQKWDENPTFPQIINGLKEVSDDLHRARSYLAADPNETLSITIILRRRHAGPPMPDIDSFSGLALSQRPRLSADEFAAKYGASPDDIYGVVEFAKAHGMTVIETNNARRTVVISGTVAQMNEANSGSDPARRISRQRPVGTFCWRNNNRQHQRLIF